jgi:hypothetical protein
MCSQKIRFRDAGETPTEEVEMAAPAKENSSPGSFNILKIFRSTASLLLYILRFRTTENPAAARQPQQKAKEQPSFLPISYCFCVSLFVRMSAVQVNNAKGEPLGKVRIGDTKQEALERLSLSGGLFDQEDVGLLNDDRITAEGAPYIFKPLQPHDAHTGQPPPLTIQARFRNHLKSSRVTATEEVMAVILRHFASSVALVDTPEQARDLYFEAALLPRSATRIFLQQQGISVAEVFRGSDPSKAVLLHAHENGAPRILKIATEKYILHECEVWSAVEATNQQSDAYLVPIKKCLFESATVDIGDISGGSSTHPAVRCGILMKHYQGTLSQCKIPLTVEVLLRYGQYLHKAVSTLRRILPLGYQAFEYFPV